MELMVLKQRDLGGEDECKRREGGWLRWALGEDGEDDGDDDNDDDGDGDMKMMMEKMNSRCLEFQGFSKEFLEFGYSVIFF